MSTANPALAGAAKKPRKVSSSKVAKKSNGPKKTSTTTRSKMPYEKIASMYEAGKKTSEISDALGLTRPKTKAGKENKYPYYLTVGALYRLGQGVKVGDKTIKIKRG